jgi:predicted transcriptional regulator
MEVPKTPVRGRIDIIADILESSVEATRKTTIMYRANLSFRQLQTYLPWLVENGFLEAYLNQGVKIYIIDKKGNAFLEVYRLLNAVLGEKKTVKE